jgi:hypothetical protein
VCTRLRQAGGWDEAGFEPCQRIRAVALTEFGSNIRVRTGVEVGDAGRGVFAGSLLSHVLLPVRYA